MLPSFNGGIWLHPQPIDFRKQIDGLVILVADHLQLNPVSGQLFLFRNRHANKIKMLWWDHNGFWLCYKRFEKGKIIFPSMIDQAIKLTRDQLSWLLSGLDYEKQSKSVDLVNCNAHARRKFEPIAQGAKGKGIAKKAMQQWH